MTTGLTRQAKTLTDVQVRALVRFVETETRVPHRNRVTSCSPRWPTPGCNRNVGAVSLEPRPCPSSVP
jgi:hypothetical protein